MLADVVGRQPDVSVGKWHALGAVVKVEVVILRSGPLGRALGDCVLVGSPGRRAAFSLAAVHRVRADDATGVFRASPAPAMHCDDQTGLR